MSPKKILISTAEVSGDQNGAHIVRELLKLDPTIEFYGMGGNKMRESGVDLVVDARGKAVVGLIETLPFLSFYIKSLKKLTQELDKRKPDLILLIDSQGINMPLAKEAKKRGIKTAYWFAPQEWLWGTPSGVRKVLGTVDNIITVFEKERDVFSAMAKRMAEECLLPKSKQKKDSLPPAKIVYFGHPLIETAVPALSRSEFYKQMELDPSKPIIGLLPGNRKQELHRLLPILLETAKNLNSYVAAKNGEQACQFLMPFYSTLYEKEIEEKNRASGLEIKTCRGMNYEVLSYSNLILSSPGTAALEATLLGTPTIVVYKLNPLTYFIAKYILRLKLEHYTMPNFIADQKVVKEFVQDDANPYQIAKVALKYLTGGETFKYDLVKSKMGTPPVLSKIARFLLS